MSKTYAQFSMRELLLVVLFVGLGLASLLAGGLIASITGMLAIVVTIGLAIVAFVGGQSMRAFAIGFLIPAIAYAAIMLTFGAGELDPFQGKLPTSRVLMYVYQAIVKQTWTDPQTGQVTNSYPGPGLGSGGGGFGGFSPYLFTESPERRTFMTLGHILIAMAFGYAGARFAVFVHRNQRESPPNHNQPTA